MCKRHNTAIIQETTVTLSTTRPFGIEDRELLFFLAKEVIISPSRREMKWLFSKTISLLYGPAKVEEVLVA